MTKNWARLMMSVAFFMFVFVVCAHYSLAQEAMPEPQASMLEKIIAWGEKTMAFLLSKEGIAAVVGGVIFSIAKAFSNQKAGPFVHALQKVVDGVAKIFELLFKLFAFLSKVIAEVIKSDGYLGKP